jgi:catechol 2,3-dioxygenase-like lactoylglutathione lyase family enzyme
MLEKMDQLVKMYDEKHISRRELLGALMVAAGAATPAVSEASQEKPLPGGNLTGAPPPKDALFRGRMINHVTLNVTDIEESRRFYQDLLGASVLLDGRPAGKNGWFDLRFGDSFVAVMGGRSAIGIDHFAVGLDPWPGAEQALAMVKERFPKSNPTANTNPLSKAPEVRSVLLKDPNGVTVQLGSATYQL